MGSVRRKAVVRKFRPVMRILHSTLNGARFSPGTEPPKSYLAVAVTLGGREPLDSWVTGVAALPDEPRIVAVPGAKSLVLGTGRMNIDAATREQNTRQGDARAWQTPAKD